MKNRILPARFPITLAALLAAALPATFAAALSLVASPLHAADPVAGLPASPLDPAAAYQEVNLKELVGKSRTELPGQRVIFAPKAIRFRAKLGALPVAQQADYLHTALNMMKISNPPQVKQRIGLDYGGERLLSAYIEEEAAKRLASQLKPGQARTFYAWHVYNYARGPALLIFSFSD